VKIADFPRRTKDLGTDHTFEGLQIRRFCCKFATLKILLDNNSLLI